MKSYDAKSRRRKISGAYSTDSVLVGAIYEAEKPKNIFIRSEAGKGMLIKTSLIPVKAPRTAGGVQILQLPKKGGRVDLVTERVEDLGEDVQKCRKTAIPSMGTSVSQLTFDF